MIWLQVVSTVLLSLFFPSVKLRYSHWHKWTVRIKMISMHFQVPEYSLSTIMPLPSSLWYFKVPLTSLSLSSPTTSSSVVATGPFSGLLPCPEQMLHRQLNQGHSICFHLIKYLTGSSKTWRAVLQQPRKLLVTNSRPRSHKPHWTESRSQHCVPRCLTGSPTWARRRGAQQGTDSTTGETLSVIHVIGATGCFFSNPNKVAIVFHY